MASPALDRERLVPLLAGLTLVTGFVDAVSYLKLGHVFVANMTGNIVFLGFAIGGVDGISIAGSLAALAAFLAGAAAGGRYVTHHHGRPGRLVLAATATQTVLLAVSCAVALASATPAGGYAVIVVLGLAMGVQNAVVRNLAVADITTTVLTMTLTGLAADSSLAGGTNPRVLRRLGAVALMFAGALAGALVVLRLGIAAALAAAALILAAVTLAAVRFRELAS